MPYMPANPQSPDLSSKEFSVDNPSLSSTPVPEASGTNFDRVAGDPLQKPQQVINNNNNSSGGGFNPLGLLGPIGSILGGLFASGGPVGTYPNDGFTGNRPLAGDKAQSFAGGGEAEKSLPVDKTLSPTDQKSYIEPPNQDYMNALAMGYLTGALHQEKYGGTPDTLSKAAQEIKQHLDKGNTVLMGMPRDFNEYDTRARQQMRQPGEGTQQIREDRSAQPGMATGGDVQLAQAALNKALGLPENPNAPNAETNPQSQQVPTNTANAVTAQQQPQPAQPPMAPATPQTDLQQQPRGFASPREQYSRTARPTGRGFAAGGPEDDGTTAPLGPGQTFQGDGSVKGPGGPTDDSIPARLSNGEFVFSEPAVQFFGVDKLTQMNEKGKQGFMQAMQQVQGNQAPQQGSPGAPPQAAPQGQAMPMPQASPAPPQPAMAAKGGPMNSLSLRKNSGYMGL
jgi:hypothetical protein